MRARSLVPEQQLRQARLQLVAHGPDSLSDTALAPTGIDEGVTRSWRRSLAAGLRPDGPQRAPEPLDARELQRTRACNDALLRHSAPVMEHLFEQVCASHSMVILADAQGVLMHSLGELNFLSKAERVALRCGASWAETLRGTNAIGTALAEAREVEIHGGEHFLARNGFLTCAATPIWSAQGQLMGVLDISGEQRSRHPHTLSLVSGAARMIENSLMLASHRHQHVLQLHSQAEGLGTVAQGVLSFSCEGWLVGANAKAMALLGLRAADLNTLRWEQIFDTARGSASLDALEAQTSRGLPRPLCSTRGQTFWVRVQGPGLTGHGHGHAHAHSHAPLRGADAHSSVTSAVTSVAQASRADGPAAPATPARPEAPDALSALDSGDPRWRRAAEQARRVLRKQIPLLVLGESGVGKELFVRALHASSDRKHQPFVALNCAALPEGLIEAELFGHAPGAFTGALPRGHKGRLREAHGGTLFLDEIGDMPLALQSRLLRVLQEREVVPLGSGQAQPLDVQLVCATHQDLPAAIAQGRFRADLYHRIHGLALQLPALRERQDFAALTRRLLDEAAPGAHLQIAPDVMQALAAYAWPGNLRQYRHVLHTAVALHEALDGPIGWPHLSDEMLHALRPSFAERPAAGTMARAAQAERRCSLEALTQRAIEEALREHQGNVSAAARQLGVCRQTLYRKLSAHAPRINPSAPTFP